MKNRTMALCALAVGAALSMAACQQQQQQQQVKVEPIKVYLVK